LNFCIPSFWFGHKVICNKQYSVVYLVTSPLSKRDFDRFGIQNWINRGWRVQVFDFTKFLKPEFWDYVDGQKMSFEFAGLKIFEDEKSALDSLAVLEKGSVFIDVLSSSRAEQKIRQISQNIGLTLKMRLGLIPIHPNHSIVFSKIQMAMKDPRLLYSYFKNKIRLSHENTSDYLIVGGTSSLKGTLKKNPIIIHAHNLDYDFFIEKQNAGNKSNNGELVFLDVNGPYHSDFIHSGKKPYVTAENYYKTINTGLLQIGKALNCPVKIAAHPRSDYENKKYKYSFPIIKDQTFDLIQQASAIISQGSTSLQWAIVMNKPILLITTNELNRSNYASITDGFAFELGKKVVNLNLIEKNYDWKQHLHIDEKKYQKYIDKYVKFPKSPEKSVWEIVIDRLEEDLSKYVRY
jgi:hypothetical protein